jgi:archaeosine synthase beta-subunit
VGFAPTKLFAISPFDAAIEPPRVRHLSSAEKTADSIELHRRSLDADRPQAFFEEWEPSPDGKVVGGVTALLTASRCPLRCTMCDLWHHTLPHPTPVGSVAKQLDLVLASTTQRDWIKLYNAGNFFDTQSIPTEDYEAIAERVGDFNRVIVENHPNIGRRHLPRFESMIRGQLEVAIGLETVQGRMLQHMNKRFTYADFESYLVHLRSFDTDARAFLILGGPEWNREESIRWAKLSIRYAARLQCRSASVIPARFGHGWNGQGKQLPTWTTEGLFRFQLQAIEDLKRRCSPMMLTMDTWNIDRKDPLLPSMIQLNQTQSMESAQGAYVDLGGHSGETP